MGLIAEPIPINIQALTLSCLALNSSSINANLLRPRLHTFKFTRLGIGSRRRECRTKNPLFKDMDSCRPGADHYYIGLDQKSCDSSTVCI